MGLLWLRENDPAPHKSVFLLSAAAAGLLRLDGQQQLKLVSAGKSLGEGEVARPMLLSRFYSSSGSA